MKKPFSMIILTCILLSTGCSVDKTPPTIELLQKDVIATDTNYDPTENVLTVEDDVDGDLKYSKSKGNIAGKYTIERRNISDYGYTAVVSATDKAGNNTEKKFSVIYANFVDKMEEGLNLNSPEPESADDGKDVIKEQPTNYDVGSPEERNNPPSSQLKENVKQLDTPYARSEISDGLLYVSWPAVDNADYYLVSLDGGAPKEIKVTSYSYEAAELGGREPSNHTITVQACKYYHSEFVDSEVASISVQFEPQLKTISVMYFLGEYTYIDSGNHTVDVYVGTDYTYHELDTMAGGFAAASQRTLQDPAGTVHIYNTTLSIQIYLNE